MFIIGYKLHIPPMSRNIFLTFDEYTEIRNELGIKRKKCKITNQMEDEFWNFRIPPFRLREWKKEVKKGWSDGYCFERTGVWTETLENLKSQHLINTLCKQEWRCHDLNNCAIFEIEREHQFFNFLGWIFNARLKEELDIRTPKERLHKIWQMMGKKMRLKDKNMWFQSDLEYLANEVMTKC